ncbi:MAG: F0F1 ATP synthase subunit delta [Actinomycetota bacterium]|nr:F0F1 ATP synthase subunit delta [Actinomycetota bacterium]MDQ2956646.1 F0F1 ATP synthase subunit delta [Actinomycetota bacterium]
MMINAASRAAIAELRDRLSAALPGLSADGHRELAAELYSVARLLTAQPRLRRTLGDPSTDASNRSELAGTLFTGKLDQVALGLVTDAVGLRWSSPWDLADSLQILADETLLSAAEQDGNLDTVEDELFRFERILAGAGELVSALDESGVPAPRRQELLDSLLGGKVQPITAELLAHALASDRKRSLLLAIDDLLEASAARRQRSVARVISATELTDEQTQRLATSLTGLYGRPISVRSAVDERVRGGLVVRVGDEVIDGTVATRLAQARAAFAG